MNAGKKIDLKAICTFYSDLVQTRTISILKKIHLLNLLIMLLITYFGKNDYLIFLKPFSEVLWQALF